MAIEPAPGREKRTSWKTFLKAQWDVMAATDFFTVEVWAPNGLLTCYVLFVVRLKTRCVHIAGVTTAPNGTYIKQVARNLTDVSDGFLVNSRYLIMDRDTKYTEEFRDYLDRDGVKPVHCPARAPNCNAYAERFVRSIKDECLDRIILFGEATLRRALREYVTHFRSERNHQGVGNRLLEPLVTQEKRNETLVALNVTRTRVTVLTFNLTIIALMVTMLSRNKPLSPGFVQAHLTISVALFIGFCLTLFGLWWLLMSQNLDSEGLSRPWPFTLGALTTYLALSQTVTAFMHLYLVEIRSTVEVAPTGADASYLSLVPIAVIGNVGLAILYLFGGAIWVLMTYIAPFFTGLRAPITNGRKWVLAGYYFALQAPIYWLYAKAWHLQHAAVQEPMNMLHLFALQFIQPLFWFR